MSYEEFMNSMKAKMVPQYFRRDGTPYPQNDAGLIEWAKDFGNQDLKRVAIDKLPNGVEVSTIWLGLDHNFGFKGRPLIFETMVFSSAPQWFEYNGLRRSFKPVLGEQWRYPTEEEALRGHRTLVQKWSLFKSVEQVLDSPKT